MMNREKDLVKAMRRVGALDGAGGALGGLAYPVAWQRKDRRRTVGVGGRTKERAGGPYARGDAGRGLLGKEAQRDLSGGQCGKVGLQPACWRVPAADRAQG